LWGIQEVKIMKKASKVNISPLEVEVENKISSAYLFSVASKSTDFNLTKLFERQGIDTSIENPQQINQSINNKTNQR